MNKAQWWKWRMKVGNEGRCECRRAIRKRPNISDSALHGADMPVVSKVVLSVEHLRR